MLQLNAELAAIEAFGLVSRDAPESSWLLRIESNPDFVSDLDRRLGHPNNRVIGCPAAIGRGRPKVSTTSVAGSIPSAQNMVAATSSGLTGSVAG